MFKKYFSPDNTGARYCDYIFFFVAALIMMTAVTLLVTHFNKQTMFRVNFEMKAATQNDRGFVRVSTDMCFDTDTSETIDCPQIP